jgi:hypothetical protein
MDERLRHKVPTIDIRDIRPDPEALNELKMIGAEELPDARAMWSVPPPIAVLRPAVRDEAGAGPSNVSRVEAKAGSRDGAQWWGRTSCWRECTSLIIVYDIFMYELIFHDMNRCIVSFVFFCRFVLEWVLNRWAH